MLRLWIFSLFIFTNALAFDEVGFNLSEINEDHYLGPDKEARLLALANDKEPFDKKKAPLILVHGIRGRPSDQQEIIDRFIGTNFQLYVLAYDDFRTRVSKNGLYLAKELQKLNSSSYTIIAHSMGGLVVRKALVELITKKKISSEHQINFYSIDTPWHGFSGPGDHEMNGWRMGIARLFLPDGLEDMRAKSDFFLEINKVKFPSSIKTFIAFAEEGDEALDYRDQILDEHQRHNLLTALALTGDLEAAEASNFENFYPVFPEITPQSYDPTRINTVIQTI